MLHFEEPARHALIILGMQKELLSEDGFFNRNGLVSVDKEDVPALVSKVNALASSFRAVGMPVFHGTWSFRPDYADCAYSKQWLRHGLRESGVFVAGSAGVSFVEGLEHCDDDFYIPLKAHSAFQYTPLERILRNCNVETCVLVGGDGEGAIEDSARQGTAYGYRIILPPDAIFPLNNIRVRQLVNRAEILDSHLVGDILRLGSLPYPLPTTLAV
jgi:nicotinamidase-related amidase